MRGLLDLYRQNWEKQQGKYPEIVLQYINKLMNSLLQSLNLTTEKWQSQQGKPKSWCGKKARERLFSPGQKVLRLRSITG